MFDLDLQLAIDTARKAAYEGGQAALAHFRRGVPVERKQDDSPVTIADKQAEKAIIEIIRSTFPHHNLLTEESGTHGSGSRFRWVIDPLDGTRGFTRDGDYWGPLVALEADGQVVVSAMCLPALDRNYWAGKGVGAFKGDGEPIVLSEVSNWDNAIVSLGELQCLLPSPYSAAIIDLVNGAFSSRSLGDLGSVAMVLEGRADVWIEYGVHLWDLAPHKLLLEEAGGRFSDFEGRPTHTSGNAVGGNRHLHEYVLNRFANR